VGIFDPIKIKIKIKIKTATATRATVGTCGRIPGRGRLGPTLCGSELFVRLHCKGLGLDHILEARVPFRQGQRQG